MNATKVRTAWLRLCQILIIGYSSMGRTFAYIGIWPAKLFISELVLLWFVVRRSGGIDWFISRSKRTKQTELLFVAMVILLVYGVFQVLHGYFNRQPIMPAIQNLAFNYYPIYIIIGAWVCRGTGPFLPQLFRWFGWIHGIYGALWVLVLNKYSFQIPGTPGVELFGQPCGSAPVIIGLLCFEPKIRRAMVPILLNVFTLIGTQVRSEWLAFMVGFAVWSVLSRRLQQFIALTVALGMLVFVGFMFDVRIPGPVTRGGEISVQGIVGRMIAPFDPQLAAKYVDDADAFEGTTKWRTRWWDAIWLDINHGRSQKFFLGNGYGFPIADLGKDVEEGIRTPHNIFFYCLAYTGWSGVAVFAFLQVAMVGALYRAYRRTGQAFGMSFWVVSITTALLGNTMESPFGAIPFYLLVGISIAPLLDETCCLAGGAGYPKIWRQLFYQQPRYAQEVDYSTQPQTYPG